MQRSERSFIKKGKERKDRNVLLKRTDAQPYFYFAKYCIQNQLIQCRVFFFFDILTLNLFLEATVQYKKEESLSFELLNPFLNKNCPPKKWYLCAFYFWCLNLILP